jgi:hypothetical protein
LKVVRHKIIATTSATSSLAASDGDVSQIYDNSEPYLCADYEYDFVDINGEAIAESLKSKLSVAGDKIYFD